MDEMDEIWPDGFFWISGQIFLAGFSGRIPRGIRSIRGAKTGSGSRPGFYNKEMEAMGLEPMTSRV